MALTTAATTATDSLRRELARAQDALERANEPMARLGMARTAFDKAERDLADHDAAEGAAWSAWAASGVGVQPAPNTEARARLVAQVDTTRAAMNSAAAIAPQFAATLNAASAALDRAAARMHHHQLQKLQAHSEALAAEYLASAEHTARLRDHLLGVDQMLASQFSDCRTTGHSLGNENRIAGILHNRHMAFAPIQITGFDLKTTEGKTNIIIPAKPSQIEEGKALALRIINED